MMAERGGGVNAQPSKVEENASVTHRKKRISDLSTAGPAKRKLFFDRRRVRKGIDRGQL
jgi:hypothetical protein